ncbi:hypothetical protein DXG03_000053 [Asterophora parasitica]|uniref:Arrestin-like N-terminal domain-containing protein n=1 Tax=Asterophora parasitica TaxID=117018 RepID=A0A9P7KIG2_9AGAR|nr:hypothetical protein DXG03_000053 [Asterophora parasitica]
MPPDAPPGYSRTTSPVFGSSPPDSIDVDVYPRESPRYSAVFALHGRPTPANRSSRPLRTKHTFTLLTGNAPWVTLKCISRAGSATSTPKFEGRDDIAGSVELDLTASKHINAITVTVIPASSERLKKVTVEIQVRGRIITGGTTNEGSQTFLNHTHTLWSKAHGDPRHASSTKNDKVERKVAPGVYTWDFSFPSPEMIDSIVDPDPITKAYTTTQSFMEQSTPVTVHYELELRVGRGTLRADKTLVMEHNRSHFSYEL